MQPKQQPGSKPELPSAPLKLLQKSKIPSPKPWIDARGFPLSDEELKIRSVTWSAETWEQYLQSLEGSRREDLGVRKDRRLLLEDFVCSEGGEEGSFIGLMEYEPEQKERTHALTAFIHDPTRADEPDPSDIVIPEDKKGQLLVDQSVESSQQEEEFDLNHEIETAMQEALTVNESLVIWHLFWDGRSEWRIACLLRRARRTVRTWRDRAFLKLRPALSPVFSKYEKARISEFQNIPGYYLMIRSPFITP